MYCCEYRLVRKIQERSSRETGWVQTGMLVKEDKVSPCPDLSADVGGDTLGPSLDS